MRTWRLGMHENRSRTGKDKNMLCMAKSHRSMSSDRSISNDSSADMFNQLYPSYDW
jgi:hypothetical protein